MGPEFFWLLVWVVVGALVGYGIGDRLDRPVVGTLGGLLFGPLGWLVVWIDGSKYECPDCKGGVPKEAAKCRHCGTSL